MVKNAKTWVVKIGSSILTDKKGALDPKVFRILAKQVAGLIRSGRRIILVSSGAIACGMHKLGFKRKPHLIPQKQAIAATGQISLMNHYDKAFRAEKIEIAQILLTRDDLADRQRYMNARHAIHELLGFKIVPVINENDTVAVEEIKVGDNDNLSSLVTNVVEADLLVILTDQEGVFTADPRTDKKAQMISLMEDIDDRSRAMARDTLRAGSTGGMITKLQAAEKAAHFGVATIIASGRDPKVLSRLAKAEEVGTLVLPKEISARLTRRKHWIAYTLKPVGRLVVDKGAKEVILEKGKSLLPSGIRQVLGAFNQGEAVDLLVEGENPFARGLAGYSSNEIEKIKGAKTGDIESRLGYKYFDEVVHRDDLVLISHLERT